MKFCYNMSFTLPKNPEDLDPSYKMDLDFWNCFGRGNTLSYNQRNMAIMCNGLLFESPCLSDSSESVIR